MYQTTEAAAKAAQRAKRVKHYRFTLWYISIMVTLIAMIQVAESFQLWGGLWS